MNWIVPLGSACDTTGDITEILTLRNSFVKKKKRKKFICDRNYIYKYLEKKNIRKREHKVEKQM